MIVGRLAGAFFDDDEDEYGRPQQIRRRRKDPLIDDLELVLCFTLHLNIGNG